MTKGKKWAFVSKAHVYATYAPNTHTYCHYVKIKESELLQKKIYIERPVCENTNILMQFNFLPFLKHI